MDSNDAASGEVIVQVFGRTDVGRTREHNEDSFVVADLTTDNATLQPEVRTHTVGQRGSLFMVADGMGGAAAGEIASDMAVKIVLEELRSVWVAAPQSTAEAFVRSIKQATKAANEQIHDYATHHPEYRGMGTTATIAGLLGDTLYLAQVGDSRAYLVRNGVAIQITKDQSLMQKLIEAGELTEEEAAASERRNIILQALGPEPTIKIDLTHQTVRLGDTLVLCSDGLSGQVTKDEIASIVSRESDLTTACKQLIDLANAAGGPDNITVIVARFEGTGLTSVEQGDQVGHRVFPLLETGQTPAIALDRVLDSNSPTQPIPVTPRPRTTRSLDEDERADAAAPYASSPLAESRLPTPSAPLEAIASIDTAQPVVSPRRRHAGRVIAVILFVILLAAVGWFIWGWAHPIVTAPSTTTLH
ncbi:MAG TPA: Stp1/IreP family PP2C-type Ser/Thr phosphatase [Gemmatimonadaceae bacterium]|jgi:protein phosphatase|nr:Stp1/IreP family PP2C-type Ser/Thr phosphatase [Gemmatimonadaceae bacterium]